MPRRMDLVPVYMPAIPPGLVMAEEYAERSIVARSPKRIDATAGLPPAVMETKPRPVSISK